MYSPTGIRLGRRVRRTIEYGVTIGVALLFSYLIVKGPW